MSRRKRRARHFWAKRRTIKLSEFTSFDSMIRRTITAHISPYVAGLAPETRRFVGHLNGEAVRHKIGVRFIATANRILAHGNLERAARSATMGGWFLRSAIASCYIAHQPLPRWETPAIEGEEAVLRRGNSLHRKELRRQEKNRPPVKEVGPFDILRRKVEIANETLYHLICAVPLEKRDREEIYPADFSTALIPLPQRTNWPADRLARWRRQGRLLCGVSRAALHGHYSLKLRDFSEPARLLFRYGRYEVVTRQQAGSRVRDILTITSELVDLPAIETRLALYLWERLIPTPAD